MRRIKELMSSNSASARLIRTIIQGVLGVLIANTEMIVGGTIIPVEYKPMVVALVMAILSPIMASIKVDE